MTDTWVFSLSNSCPQKVWPRDRKKKKKISDTKRVRGGACREDSTGARRGKWNGNRPFIGIFLHFDLFV